MLFKDGKLFKKKKSFNKHLNCSKTWQLINANMWWYRNIPTIPICQDKMFLSFHFYLDTDIQSKQVRSQKFCPIIQWNPIHLLLNRLSTYLFIFLASKMSCKPHKCVARVIFLYYEGLMIFWIILLSYCFRNLETVFLFVEFES